MCKLWKAASPRERGPPGSALDDISALQRKLWPRCRFWGSRPRPAGRFGVSKVGARSADLCADFPLVRVRAGRRRSPWSASQRKRSPKRTTKSRPVSLRPGRFAGGSHQTRTKKRSLWPAHMQPPGENSCNLPGVGGPHDPRPSSPTLRCWAHHRECGPGGTHSAGTCGSLALRYVRFERPAIRRAGHGRVPWPTSPRAP